ncbi:YutD family protein [Fructobacillus ficulneus]|uniref:Transcriptional regulator n=1 Tax=Fructobacillus ficulneus TaxID=157463 RepID=A0A0K8MJZ1_9LACO|nr:transcriptional regulator [Fructobacillus ficulneus]
MDHESLKERTLNQQAEREQEFEINVFGDEVTIDGLSLTLQENFKEAFDPAKLAIRYTPLLKQYDYIVGDISADQLRLRGFYQDDRSVTADQKISALADYLYEYVNFGAPYFVLANNAPAFRPVKVHDFLQDWQRDQKQASSQQGSKKKAPAKSQQRSKSATGTNTRQNRTSTGPREKVTNRPRKNSQQGNAANQRKHQFTKTDRGETDKKQESTNSRPNAEHVKSANGKGSGNRKTKNTRTGNRPINKTNGGSNRGQELDRQPKQNPVDTGVKPKDGNNTQANRQNSQEKTASRVGAKGQQPSKTPQNHKKRSFTIKERQPENDSNK